MNPSATSGSTPRWQRDAGQDRNIQSESTDHRRAGDAEASSSVAAGTVEPARADKPKDLAVPSGSHSGEASSSAGLKMSRDAVKMPTVEGGERLPVVPEPPDTGESSLDTRLSGIQIRDPAQERVVAEKKPVVTEPGQVVEDPDTIRKKQDSIERLRQYCDKENGLKGKLLKQDNLEMLSKASSINLSKIQDAIKDNQELPPERRLENAIELELNNYLNMSAYDALVYFRFNVSPDDYEKSEFPKQPEQLEEWREGKLAHVRDIESKLEKIRTADQILPRQADFHRKVTPDNARRARDGHDRALRLQEAYLSLKFSEMAWLVNSFQVPAIEKVVQALSGYMYAANTEFYTSHGPMIKGLGKENDFQTMAKVSADFIHFGQCFCQVAAEIAEPDHPKLSQHVMDTAMAFSEYGAHIQNVIDEKYRPRDPDEWLPPALRKTGPSDTDKASEPATKPAGKSKKKSKSKPSKGQAAASANPTQERKSLYRDELTKLVDGRLKQWQGVPDGDDPIAVARAMPGKDTDKVDTLHGEPFQLDIQKRHRANEWFGNLGQLKQLRRMLLDLPQPRETVRLAELDRCIERRERMERDLDRQKVDGLKTYEFPKAHHVKTLLESGQVDRTGVSAPVRLPSEGDVGEKGTLFEVTIQPKPRSNGQPSPRLYLHLHTDRAVSADDLDKVEPNRFTAIHLKNEVQRGLGRRWEQLAGQLGEVHRGKVGPELARNILDMAAQAPR